MEIRPLTADEINQAEALDGVQFPPENSLIIGAVTNSGKVIGRIVLMSLVHLEGTHVAEPFRGTPVALKLVAEAERTLRSNGLTSVIAYTPETDPTIGQYMKRVGYERLPVEVWQKFLPQETS